jgi:hypothetical protein
MIYDASASLLGPLIQGLFRLRVLLPSRRRLRPGRCPPPRRRGTCCTMTSASSFVAWKGRDLLDPWMMTPAAAAALVGRSREEAPLIPTVRQDVAAVLAAVGAVTVALANLLLGAMFPPPVLWSVRRLLSTALPPRRQLPRAAGVAVHEEDTDRDLSPPQVAGCHVPRPSRKAAHPTDSSRACKWPTTPLCKRHLLGLARPLLIPRRLPRTRRDRLTKPPLLLSLAWTALTAMCRVPFLGRHTQIRRRQRAVHPLMLSPWQP